MKDCNEEYFYMVPFGASYPLLEYIDPMVDSFLLHEKFVLDENHIFRFCFGNPSPLNPIMGDVHSYARHLVISNRIKEVLKTMQLKDVQYLPATITDHKNSVIYKDYNVLHIYNLINCMNRNESDFKSDRDDSSIIKWINKLVIDSEMLGKIPLGKRLVFALGEKRVYLFFHKSVVDKILAINPEGVKFAPVTKWDSKSLFEAAYWEYILGD